VKSSHTIGGAGEWDAQGEGSGWIRDERFVSGRGECVRVKL
jgi:hypothetical protein